MIDEYNTSFEEIIPTKAQVRKQRGIDLLIVFIDCILFSAIALGLQFLTIPLNGLPKILSLTLTLIPEMVVALAFGPFAGAFVVGVKVTLYYFISHCYKITVIDNFVLEGSIVFFFGLFYWLLKNNYIRRNEQAVPINTKWKHWFISLALTTVITFGVVYLFKTGFSYPYVIEKMGITRQQIIESYLFFDSSTTIEQAVLSYDCMFYIAKCVVFGTASIIIYRVISPIIKSI